MSRNLCFCDQFSWLHGSFVFPLCWHLSPQKLCWRSRRGELDTQLWAPPCPEAVVLRPRCQQESKEGSFLRVSPRGHTGVRSAGGTGRWRAGPAGLGGAGGAGGGGARGQGRGCTSAGWARAASLVLGFSGLLFSFLGSSSYFFWGGLHISFEGDNYSTKHFNIFLCNYILDRMSLKLSSVQTS